MPKRIALCGLLSACGRWGYDLSPRADLIEAPIPRSGDLAADAAPPDVATEGPVPTLDAGGVGPDGLDSGTRFDSGSGAGTPNDAAATPFDVGPPRSASCTELPPLASLPTLDGTLEDGLAMVHVVPVAWTVAGSVPPGYSLEFAAAWHPGGLYFFLDVTDPDRNPAAPTTEVWQGDGIEVYVDHDAIFAAPGTYDDPGTRQLVFSAPLDAVSNGDRGDGYTPLGLVGPYDATHRLATPTPTGYTLELWVTAADLGLANWSLAAGSRVGFDLAHNVSAPLGQPGVQGNRAGQYFLQAGPQPDVTRYPFDNSGVFCAPTLAP